MTAPKTSGPVPKGRGRRTVLLTLAGLCAAGVLALVALPRLLPAPPLLEGVPFSRTVSDRNGVLLRVTSAEDGQIRLMTPLEDVSPSVVRSLLRYEDRYFFEHPGVNVPAL
ncbi:MAG TPA: transglycosylase domain-containing protein, partial [Candidatus Sutterella merdavium]|nr:transglycosylase domain-containing protein [Candidatus Sutterella merdavium]